MSNTTTTTTLEEGLGRSGTELIVREICSLRSKIDDATNVASDNPFSKGDGASSAVLRDSSSVASGDYSVAEGEANTASGQASHAEGGYNTASGDYSHAEGYNTTASSEYSHAEGYNTTASSEYSHAEGYNTIASGYASHAEGYESAAFGDCSHAGGFYTIAKAQSQTAIGEYNIQDDNNEFYLIVGNGTSKSARNNAFTVSKSGEVMAADGLRVKEDSSSDEVVMRYDSTNKCLKFIFE